MYVYILLQLDNKWDLGTPSPLILSFSFIRHNLLQNSIIVTFRQKQHFLKTKLKCMPKQISLI